MYRLTLHPVVSWTFLNCISIVMTHRQIYRFWKWGVNRNLIICLQSSSLWIGCHLTAWDEQQNNGKRVYWSFELWWHFPVEGNWVRVDWPVILLSETESDPQNLLTVCALIQTFRHLVCPQNVWSQRSPRCLNSCGYGSFASFSHFFHTKTTISGLLPVKLCICLQISSTGIPVPSV